MDGQPALVKSWIQFWVDVVNVNPTAFAYIVALAETALAVALIFGLFSNLAYLGGALLSFVIWSVPEGLGGPYGVGSTDVGAGLIYVFVFALLWQARAGLYLGLDRRLGAWLGSLAFIASGQPNLEQDER